jgi:hypothetical protein
MHNIKKKLCLKQLLRSTTSTVNYVNLVTQVNLRNFLCWVNRADSRSWKYHLPHTYALPPDDGLLMPETCGGILIQ